MEAAFDDAPLTEAFEIDAKVVEHCREALIIYERDSKQALQKEVKVEEAEEKENLEEAANGNEPFKGSKKKNKRRRLYYVTKTLASELHMELPAMEQVGIMAGRALQQRLGTFSDAVEDIRRFRNLIMFF